jgi:BlaI family transcriptional regulator, penicillinase repressor
MARKKTSDQLTPLEMELMQVLWQTGPATVQEVLAHLPKDRDLAYTTIQTMLNLLHKKEKVKRIQVDGDRALRYEAAVTRHSAARQAIGDLLGRVFGGSAESMVLSMVESGVLTPRKLAELTHLVAESKKSKEKGRGN